MKERTFNPKKITVLYSAAFAVFFAAFCMIRSFIAVYLNDQGFSYTQVGIITGIHILFAALIQPNYSQILNHFPKLSLQHFIMICCVPAALCSLLTFYLPAKMLFFIPLYIILGLSEIGLQSLMISVGMEYVNAGIPINTGVGRGFGSIGYAAANLILGNLIIRFGSPISQKLNIVLMLLLAIILIFMPDPHSLKTQEANDEDQPGADGLGKFMRENRDYMIFIVSVILLFFGHSIVNTYMPNVAAQFGLDSDFTGYMNALAATVELIPMLLYSRISQKHSAEQLLTISAVFFTVKLLTATLARSALGIIISQCLQIPAYGLFAMAAIYFTNRVVAPHNRLLAQGLMIGSDELGFTLGSLVGGIMLDHSNIRVLLWAGVAVSVVGSVLMILSVNRFRQPESSAA